MAAARLGYRVHVFAPEHDPPAADVALRQTEASFDDLDAIAEFARSVDAITFEFENIPVAATETAARFAPVRPSGAVLHTCRTGCAKRASCATPAFPCTPFAEATTAAQLARGARANWAARRAQDGRLGLRRQRPDARPHGRRRPRPHGERSTAPRRFSKRWVDFECELSMLAARSRRRRGGVLRPACTTTTPITSSTCRPTRGRSWRPIADEAREIARTVLRELDVVGLICVEFFLARDGRLLVNEIAPRPHNSGHLTIDACACSQFEQQVRAVCGLPLGSFELTVPAAAMANLLGDVWQAGEPQWTRVLADPRLRLHLYGKTEARPGRKMGHLTALAATADEAAELVRAARRVARSRSAVLG